MPKKKFNSQCNQSYIKEISCVREKGSQASALEQKKNRVKMLEGNHMAIKPAMKTYWGKSGLKPREYSSKGIYPNSQEGRAIMPTIQTKWNFKTASTFTKAYTPCHKHIWVLFHKQK